MNMIRENARECPNDATGRNSSDTEGSLLRMSDTDQIYALELCRWRRF